MLENETKVDEEMKIDILHTIEKPHIEEEKERPLELEPTRIVNEQIALDIKELCCDELVG